MPGKSKKLIQCLRSIYQNHIKNELLDHIKSELLHHTGIKPIPFHKFDARVSVSDLFAFRAGSDWETRFDVMNISSLIVPEKKVSETVRIIMFDQNGHNICQENIRLDPMEFRSIYLHEMVPKSVQAGSFAAIHIPDDPDLMVPHKTCISERGYVGYKRKSDKKDLWSFLHGNIYVISGKTNSKKGWSPFRRTTKKHYCYALKLP